MENKIEDIYKPYYDYVASIVDENIDVMNFKSHPAMTYMLEHTGYKYYGEQWLNNIRNMNMLLDNEIIELCNLNDKYGGAVTEKFEKDIIATPNSLKYIYHSLLIIKYIQ